MPDIEYDQALEMQTPALARELPAGGARARMVASPLPAGRAMPLLPSTPSSPPLPVHFFLPGEEDLAALACLDPDREPALFRRGERAWVLQTCLRLRRAGFECELVDRVPGAGFVLFHNKHEREIRRALPKIGSPVLVGIRADNREALAAEYEIVQNGRWARPGRRLVMPLWPQPGLVPRAAERGDAIRTVAYKGFRANLHPAFRAERWRRFLAERGIEWLDDSSPYEGAATDRAALSWSDFSAVDLIVAVRPPERKTDFSKPATKLVNAWLAGTPALLGAEFAFREIRRSELDYLEIDSVAAAETAIDRLRAEPGLYRRMIEHGRDRAAEYDVPALTSRWIELLGVTLPGLAADPRRARWRRWPILLRRAARLARRWAERRPPR
jgi:hypothetical protein